MESAMDPFQNLFWLEISCDPAVERNQLYAP